MNVHKSLQRTGSEPEYKKSTPLKVSSIGTQNTTKNKKIIVLKNRLWQREQQLKKEKSQQKQQIETKIEVYE
ncbi:MAG: hypothetical protein MRERC_9c043 [Mycoplasmataceae bacterium RC_NB112A]|nr:MAG: hypothetical protein MRERC_9c043 [Mycoplasmataceae bacterium RC_NB112A]